LTDLTIYRLINQS